MKPVLISSLCLWLSPIWGAGQGLLQVGSQAHLVVAGPTALVLLDTRLELAGTLDPGQGTVVVTGAASPAQSALVSSGTLYLHDLILQKTAQDLLLATDLNLDGTLSLISGNLDLGGHTVTLGTTGLIAGEGETHRLMDPTGTGTVVAQATLLAPAQATPGNLGMRITSAGNLGLTTLTRRFGAEALGGSSSILRSITIVPAQPPGAPVSLTLSYLDAELNNLPEAGFSLFQSQDNGATWGTPGTALHDPQLNEVTLAVADPSRRWTAAPELSFPLTWLGITARWEGTDRQPGARIEWTTADETGTDYFQVMRRQHEPGALWEVLDKVPAAGTRSGPGTYTYYDGAVSPADQVSYLYRILQTDLDGRFSYSATTELTPVSAGGFSLRLYPNPASDAVQVSASWPQSDVAYWRITDMLGRVQIVQPAFKGSTVLDLSTLRPGVYQVSLVVGHEIHTQTLLLQR
ncbi:MAG: T9SS type A sorting domain-containing protein [Bacteroidia bacterium]|nr:T9SS type A sorting domain-containing protein [Bacteroidia bacterium]